MKSLILLLGLSIIIALTGCDPKLTNPDEPKTEIFIGYAVGDSGKVYKSLDNGNTWEFKQTGITSKLNSICVFTDAIAIAVGNNGIIIKTTDGGSTWSIQQSGTNVNLTKIIFNSQKNQCWISGNEGMLLLYNGY